MLASGSFAGTPSPIHRPSYRPRPVSSPASTYGPRPFSSPRASGLLGDGARLPTPNSSLTSSATNLSSRSRSRSGSRVSAIPSNVSASSRASLRSLDVHVGCATSLGGPARESYVGSDGIIRTREMTEQRYSNASSTSAMRAWSSEHTTSMRQPTVPTKSRLAMADKGMTRSSMTLTSMELGATAFGMPRWEPPAPRRKIRFDSRGMRPYVTPPCGGLTHAGAHGRYDSRW